MHTREKQQLRLISEFKKHHQYHIQWVTMVLWDSLQFTIQWEVLMQILCFNCNNKEKLTTWLPQSTCQATMEIHQISNLVVGINLLLPQAIYLKCSEQIPHNNGIWMLMISFWVDQAFLWKTEWSQLILTFLIFTFQIMIGINLLTLCHQDSQNYFVSLMRISVILTQLVLMSQTHLFHSR